MRFLTILAATFAALAGSAASAPETSLVWQTAPSFADMNVAWPRDVGDQAEARVTLQCRIALRGRMADCDGVSSDPNGLRFVSAARKLAKRFKLKFDYRSLSVDRDHFVDIPFHFINPGSADGRVRRVPAPRWITMLDPNIIQGVFPQAAAEAGVGRGVGVVDCLVTRDGHLTDCKVSREDPVGLGFGQAAMRVVPIMQMNPWSDDGRPVDGARVKVPVKFGLAGVP